MVSWEQALQRWHDGGANGIYSLSFFAEPPDPDGMFVLALSYLDPPSDSCATFESEQYLQASSTRDDWVLFVHLSTNRVGTFAVVPDNQVGGEPSAQVMLKRITRGVESLRRTGLAGDIQVSEVALNLADWHAGAALRLAGNVEFSTQEADTRLGCEIGGATDAAGYYQHCFCRREDGSVFTCDRKPEEVNCCIDLGAERRQFTFTLEASRCAARCVSTDLLLNHYCSEL